MSGNSASGKKVHCVICKNTWNYTFQPAEATVFSPDVFFLVAGFIKFPTLILSGKFEFTSGKCQESVREFWSVLNVRTLD